MWNRERHPDGLVGNLFRINDVDSIHLGNFEEMLSSGDLVLCIRHSGDCFQDYIVIEELSDALKGIPDKRFGSYGIGNASKVDDYHLDDISRAILVQGKYPVWIEDGDDDEEPEVIVTIKKKK